MIFKSFKEMANAMGIKVKPREESEKKRTCQKCGSKLRHIDGTNVFVCDGVTEKGEACNAKYAVPVFRGA